MAKINATGQIHAGIELEVFAIVRGRMFREDKVCLKTPDGENHWIRVGDTLALSVDFDLRNI